MKIRLYSAFTFCLLLTSCSSQSGEWYKPNSTLEEYSKVRYVCLQQSQQRQSESQSSTSSKTPDENSSSSSSEMATNDTLFNACMNSEGFYWRIVNRNGVNQ